MAVEFGGGSFADVSGNLNLSSTDSFTVIPEAPLSLQFDFGTASSPVGSGYNRVTSATGYSSSLGHGWATGGSRASYDTGVSSEPVNRDYVYTTGSTFLVDLPAGWYDISVSLGDLSGATVDQQSIVMEGNLQEVVTVPGGQVQTRTYKGVRVEDGQLTLQLTDLGGSNPYVAITGLRVTKVAAPGPDVGSATLFTVEKAKSSNTSHSRFSQLISSLTRDEVENLLYLRPNHRSIGWNLRNASAWNK